jgi:hypothetical protein
MGEADRRRDSYRPKVHMERHSFTQAHYTVLHNSTMVAPYIERHKNILCSENPGKVDSWIKGEHEKTFGSWLQTYLMNNNTVGDQLYYLARPPSSTIYTFQGYEINGNIFYMVAQDKKSTNQNSGVRFDATDDNGQKDTYYRYIEEIWELDYGPTFKIPLFWCKWVKLTGYRAFIHILVLLTAVEDVVIRACMYLLHV